MMSFMAKEICPPSAEAIAAPIAPTSISSEPIRVKMIIFSVADWTLTAPSPGLPA